METAYCEIIEHQRRTQINIYTQEQYDAEIMRRRRVQLRRKREAARARRMNRLRETIGSFVSCIGFACLIAAGGCFEIWQIIVTGIVGLAMIVLGGWMAHAFYGQEKDAEWLRRLQENEGARK